MYSLLNICAAFESADSSLVYPSRRAERDLTMIGLGCNDRGWYDHRLFTGLLR